MRRAHASVQRWLDVLPAAALLVVSAVFIGWLMFRPPEEARRVAVIFPPGTDFASLISQVKGVNGRVIRTGALASIAVIDLGRERNLDRLTIPGAWAVADPLAVAGCFDVPDWAVSGSPPGASRPAAQP